jgi:hypothetical protein
MCAERLFGHELKRHFAGKPGLHAAGRIDLRQFFRLMLGGEGKLALLWVAGKLALLWVAGKLALL